MRSALLLGRRLDYSRTRRDLAAAVRVLLGAIRRDKEFDYGCRPHPMTWPRHWTGDWLAVGPCATPARGRVVVVLVVVAARHVWVTVIHGSDSYRAAQQLYRPARSTAVCTDGESCSLWEETGTVREDLEAFIATSGSDSDSGINFQYFCLCNTVVSSIQIEGSMVCCRRKDLEVACSGRKRSPYEDAMATLVLNFTCVSAMS